MGRKRIPEDRLFDLKNKLGVFPERSADRKRIIREFANVYGVSVKSVYRALQKIKNPHNIKRSDIGIPRCIPKDDLERYCRIIAALKFKSTNKKGRHLSTAETIRILEYGVNTREGLIKAPKGLLTKSTVNHYLKLWGYNFAALSVEPAAVRFQAKHANQCWHFDLSPSDLKTLDNWPEWIEKRDGRPVLMLYSVVDDRSGVAFQKYDVVYGEDAESALRFLFLAMSQKNIDGFPFYGIPEMLYMDNGSIAKSSVFRRVMQYLGVNVRTHLPGGKDGRRTTARSKGKVERPFRTVKEVHETLYHFHKPGNINEANDWLQNYILRYNEKPHRSENHSRIDDWLRNIPPSGIREMCAWDRFCSFAREPERRKVGPDAQIRINGITYEVSHELADHEVVLWWGLFDNDLFVEHGSNRYGPYQPGNGPIPLHRFRKRKKTEAEKRADSIETLAREINVPIDIMREDSRPIEALLKKLPVEAIVKKFDDPDPFHEKYFPNEIRAKLAISKMLGKPLAKLSDTEMDIIDKKLSETLEKSAIREMVNDYFKNKSILQVIKGDKK